MSCFVHSYSVGADHDEADEGQDERGIGGGEGAQNGALVDDGGLERGQYASAEDGHDETGCSELGIVAKALQGNAVDGGEHERHATADGHEAIHAEAILEENDAERAEHATDGKGCQETGGIDVFHEVGGHETGADEEQHSGDVEALGEHFGGLLAHAFGHEDARAVLDDEGPAHDLRTHVEELGDDALAIVSEGEDAAQGGHEMDVAVLVAVLGHLDEHDDDEHGHDDESDGQIGRDEDGEVGLLHGVKLLGREVGALGGRHGVEPCLDEVHGHIHADDGAAGVEALGHVESARGGFLGAHREDVGVAGGLEERESAGHDEIGDEEASVDAHHLGREEEQRARGIEPEAHQHTRLIREFPNEDGCREGHAEVASVEGHLHECSLGDAHPEDLGEGFHHRVGDVVGKAPEREAEGDQDEGDEVVGRDDPSPVPSRGRGECTVFGFSTHVVLIVWLKFRILIPYFYLVPFGQKSYKFYQK